MLHKNFPFEFKKLDDSGTFEATVAIFNNVDRGGDRIIPGAFAKTLAHWEASGDPIPVIFNHDWATPDAHVGVVTHAEETTKGLFVRGKLDVEDNPVAKQVHRLMQRRSLKEFSFGYSVPAGGEKRAKDGANDLLQIDLAEVGPTLKGMNPATELHNVKSALGVVPDAKAQREESDRLEREIAEVSLPEVKSAAPVKDDGPDLAAELADVRARLENAEKALEEKPDPAELRRESDRIARELAEAKVPDVPAPTKRLASSVRDQIDLAGAERFPQGENAWSYLDDYDPDQGWAVFSVASAGDRRYVRVTYSVNADETVTLGAEQVEVTRGVTYRPKGDGNSTALMSTELQEVKRELADLRKKADETDKEPPARSVDPLRRRSEELALELSSAGMSLSQPPKKAPPPTRDGPSLDALKRESRDLMFTVLSYHTE